MCTVTLSYDRNDKVAKDSLATLLATGRFVQLDAKEESEIDYSDHSLFETDPSLPIDRDMTPEELEKLILEDIHAIYARQNAV